MDEIIQRELYIQLSNNSDNPDTIFYVILIF